MNTQPQFFKMNDDQSVMLVATDINGTYINMKTQMEYDLDEEYHITCLKQVMFDSDDG